MQEYFSPFPHGTSSLSVAKEYLALGDGPPSFPQDFSCPVVLGNPSPLHSLLSTGLLPSMDRLSSTIRLGSAVFCLVPQPPSSRSRAGLGCFRFARRYSGNRDCFLFLRVLRWFTSPSLLPSPMNSVMDDSALPEPGSPIRTSPDQSLLAAPRGLSQLATSFIASLRLGIHRLPLVA